MRKITIASIITTAIIGLGAVWTAAPSAQATTTGSQHEVRVIILTNNTADCVFDAPCDWHGLGITSLNTLAIASLNASAYPSGAQVTLSVTAGSVRPGMTACFRLAQRDASIDPAVTGTPITSSETCATQPSSAMPFLIESLPVTLAAGNHFYGVDFRADGPPATNPGDVIVEKAEIVIRWTDPAPDTYIVKATSTSLNVTPAYCDLGDSLTGGGIETDGNGFILDSHGVTHSTTGAAGWWGQQRNAVTPTSTITNTPAPTNTPTATHTPANPAATNTPVAPASPTTTTVPWSTNVTVWVACLDKAPYRMAVSVGGVAEQPALLSIAGHGMAVTPGVVVMLIAVAGIAAGSWYVQRKRAG